MCVMVTNREIKETRYQNLIGKKGVREEGEAEEGDDGGVEMSVIGCDDIFSRYEKLN